LDPNAGSTLRITAVLHSSLDQPAEAEFGKSSSELCERDDGRRERFLLFPPAFLTKREATIHLPPSSAQTAEFIEETVLNVSIIDGLNRLHTQSH
jgi:hypothetical protein